MVGTADKYIKSSFKEFYIYKQLNQRALNKFENTNIEKRQEDILRTILLPKYCKKAKFKQ